MEGLVSSVTKKMITYFDGDVKRINHAIKVYGFAKTIGILEEISEEKLRVLEVASILHDIGIKESERKYSSSAAKYQELEGPPVAFNILQEFDLTTDFVDRVSYLIGNHHTYHRVDDMDFQILVEADFIVNISEGCMGKEQVRIIMENYFKTSTGISLVESMYKPRHKE